MASVLVIAASDRAQDAITGTWTGEFLPDSRKALSVTLQLKFDGKGAVTGTVSGLPNPADVKVGTFDPKNGALKLHLGAVGEPQVLLTLDGTVANDAATGRVTDSSGDEGKFKIARQK